MFDFRMSLSENFASFRDEKTGKFVFVDSFDNHEFSVRMGTLRDSRLIGTVVAKSSEDLNAQLRELVAHKSE
ncbi:hypothetical protein [Burkholderia ubonensis]|uniref:hypothetical protein n=1 Tax=Burkholderia ubonensis TaxID=101571 RepID=UPI000759CE27|nr:hypothetical protein [Burkholderia ubonensis]KVO22728.1 hypothetical protein WJ74_34970 [Burkholderia ubonensis]KVT62205.1 hypothetical protein WK54_07825 [Burkholderia ubonensis]